MLRVAKATLDYTHFPTLLFGISAIVIMVGLRKINPRIPNVLIAVSLTTVLSYFIGFNNDTRIDLSAIRSPELGQIIAEFNESVLSIENLGEKRASVGLQVDEEIKAEKENHTKSKALVQLQSQVAVLTIEIEEAKHHGHQLRTDLRAMKFEAVKENDKYTFYPKTHIPPGIETDGKTWRLKIGNTVLDSTSLLLMGGGAVVGTIPKGLPQLTMPDLTVKSFFKLLPTAIIISLLGFMEAIAIAKAMAAKTGQKLDPNQELIGQGLANMIGSIGSSYPISGSFSRSAVNLQAGAVSGISSVVTSLMVIITLLFFTPLLYHLPQAVLAAVIMMAVIGLVNVRGFIHAWKAQWYDGAISILSFLVTLYYAPHLDKGIMVGVALSMVIFLYKSMRPVVASLSLNEENVLKSSEHYRLKGCRHISVVRFDGALFFANASYLDEQVSKFRTEQPDLRYILLDARGINDMDASGEEALEMLCRRIRSARLGFAICGVKGQVLGVMERTGLIEEIGKEHMFADSRTAVAEIINRIHQGTDLPQAGCDGCPLTQYIPAEK
jgi:anti-anti-sigma factor